MLKKMNPNGDHTIPLNSDANSANDEEEEEVVTSRENIVSGNFDVDTFGSGSKIVMTVQDRYKTIKHRNNDKAMQSDVIID